MTIEFTKADLDYLAEKIAEKLKGSELTPAKEKENIFDNMTIQQALDGNHAQMSVRCWAILHREGLASYTIKQLAGVMWRDYRRVRGIGARTYLDLCCFFSKLGYEPGWNHIKYDIHTKKYHIVQKPQ